MLYIAEKMVHLSNLAYSSDESFVDKKLKEMGYEPCKWFKNDNTQSFVTRDKNTRTIIVCFRGTDEPSDMLNNVKAWLRKTQEGGGHIHSGFADSLNHVGSDIFDYLRLQRFDSDWRIIFTGHSLGAALATIMAYRLKYEDRNRDKIIYTFGSPRVGDGRFVKEIKEITHYRFVNNNDIVTRFPFRFFLYRHHAKAVYIDYHGKIRKMTFWQRVKDRIRGRLRAFQKGEAFDGYYDHSMDEYCQKIRENL